MSTIDNVDFTGVTIDGTEVNEITMDGNIVYSKASGGLRNIQVGDDITNKVLYFSFPENLWASLLDGNNDIFTTNNSNGMYTSHSDGYNAGGVHMSDGNPQYYYYEGLLWNYTSIEAGYITGIVNYIDTSNPAYQYIKIEA